jgi:hypothetical protein
LLGCVTGGSKADDPDRRSTRFLWQPRNVLCGGELGRLMAARKMVLNKAPHAGDRQKAPPSDNARALLAEGDHDGLCVEAGR